MKMWHKVLGGLALSLAMHAQGQVDAHAVRASVFNALVESSNLKKEGNFDGALAMLEALDLSDSSAVELALVRESLANTYQMTRQHEQARAYYRLLLDEPTNLTPKDMNRLWYRLATASLQLEDYEEVLRVVEEWRNRVPHPGPDSLKMRAYALFWLDDRAAALVAGERYVAALRAEGDAVPSSFANFLKEARRPKGETSDFYTTELRGLARPDVLEMLVGANELIELRRFAKASALLSEMIDAEGATTTDMALLREKLAWVLGLRRDMVGAREQYRRIVLAPGDLPSRMLDQMWMRFASVCYKTQAYEDAIKSAETWKNRVGDPPPLYFRLTAMAHWQLDDRESAIGYGKRYVDEAQQAGEEVSASFKALFADVLGDEIVLGN